MTTEVKLVFSLGEEVTPELFSEKVRRVLTVHGVLRPDEAVKVAHDQVNQCDRMLTSSIQCPRMATVTVNTSPGIPLHLCDEHADRWREMFDGS